VSKSVSSSSAGSQVGPDGVNLRDPLLAAVLAWLVPGAGHWYQRRRSKAVLFFVCITSTFVYGLWIGDGRVVYADWGPTPEQKRLPFLCQAGVGAAALPALYQAKRFSDVRQYDAANTRAARGEASFWDEFMVPPRLVDRDRDPNYVGKPGVGDELDELNKTLNRRFELGTVYTMVAGLLNVLVIFDAFGGPAYAALKKKEPPAEREDEKPAATAQSSA
jgi:hypothetical protein